jgi:H+/Cl- antiporter ClcA
VGGILGAVVFHAVVASTHRVPGYQLGQFLLGISVGLAGGLVGVALLWLLLRKLRLGEVLGTSAQLASVVAVAGRMTPRHPPRVRPPSPGASKIGT